MSAAAGKGRARGGQTPPVAAGSVFGNGGPRHWQRRAMLAEKGAQNGVSGGHSAVPRTFEYAVNN